MNNNRSSGVAVAVSLLALFAVAIGPATQTTSNSHRRASAVFPAHEGTRTHLPESEKAVFTELRNAGIQVCDRFT